MEGNKTRFLQTVLDDNDNTETISSLVVSDSDIGVPDLAPAIGSPNSSLSTYSCNERTNESAKANVYLHTAYSYPCSSRRVVVSVPDPQVHNAFRAPIESVENPQFVIVKIPQKTPPHNQNNRFLTGSNSQASLLSQAQLLALERIYAEKTQAPTTTQYYKLASALAMNQREVMLWFRKRRMSAAAF
ncbi:hypothetical protein HK100_011026 [Physocladia obscura]|uniref:Homeobox domain-containing protein n=1 Tax=Physocladia obscura TaxID=109957 RepID=A0AAD5XDJ8_9FUNG|nr:hypothetical protein HK100_011026 [Physocladia obscura]